MRVEMTRTRYNIAALIGWAGLLVGLVGCALQYQQPSMPGFAFLVVGVLGGGITVTLAGPVRTTERHMVDVPDKNGEA